MFPKTPNNATYDVIIIGGAIMGSSTAWFLTNNPDFQGRILVVERDPNYEFCSTAHTNSCIRQQFSTELNIRISQFTADFYKNLRANMGDDPRIPDLHIQNFGYLYMTDNEAGASVLRENQKIQAACGAGTQIFTPEEIAAKYPFYNMDGVTLCSHNTLDEGYFDGAAMFDWMKRKARENGAEYIWGEVAAINRDGNQIKSVTLASGEVISCDHLINASGPRAARTAQMAGLDIPVEPRKRYTWVFSAAKPLDQPLPLTIDPSGIHVRELGGGTYLTGGQPFIDTPPDFDDFTMDQNIFEQVIWPGLAHRIPAFEAIKVTSEWAGHYAYNTLDQNAVIGPHPEVANFYFQNGFSGHGLQQSPAMGRAMSELITHGEFRTLDMTPFGYERIVTKTPIVEKAVI